MTGEMTREEAKVFMLQFNTDKRLNPSEHEAVRVAIKVLEQEPCEDCISRQSLKHKLQEHHDFFVNAYGGFSNLPQNDKSRVDEITNCIAMVVNEPCIQPKSKTGHWIGHREHCENLGVMPSGLGAYEWCSNCDCGIDVREWHRNNYNFCPNCGVKMLPASSKKGVRI